MAFCTLERPKFTSQSGWCWRIAVNEGFGGTLDKNCRTHSLAANKMCVRRAFCQHQRKHTHTHTHTNTSLTHARGPSDFRQSHAILQHRDDGDIGHLGKVLTFSLGTTLAKNKSRHAWHAACSLTHSKLR